LEGRAQNHEGVVEEDRRAKLPKNYEAKRRRAEWAREEASKRKAAEEQGLDYDRLCALEVGPAAVSL